MPRLKGSADLLEDRRRRALALWDSGLSLNETVGFARRQLMAPGLATLRLWPTPAAGEEPQMVSGQSYNQMTLGKVLAPSSGRTASRDHKPGIPSVERIGRDGRI